MKIKLPLPKNPVLKRLVVGLFILSCTALCAAAVFLIPYVAGIVAIVGMVLLVLIVAFAIGDTMVDRGEGW